MGSLPKVADASESAAAGSNICETNQISFDGDLFDNPEKSIDCDTVLTGDDGERIAAHHRVLNESNSFFEKLLTRDMDQGISEIVIRGVRGEIWRQIIECCFASLASIDDANVSDTTKAAAMQQFAEILNKCAEIYSTILSPSNALGIREIAEQYNMVRLQEIAHHFILDHFVDVSKTDEFYQLSVDKLCALLQEDGINAPEEDDVFVALIMWVKYDASNRMAPFHSLLDCIRFRDTESPMTMEKINKHCTEAGCPELFSSVSARRKTLNQNQLRRPSTVRIPFHLVSNDDIGINVESYCTRSNEWSSKRSYKVNLQLFSTIQRNGKLILVGGTLIGDQEPLTMVKSLDLRTKRVINLPSMGLGRIRPSVALLTESMYVLGGVCPRSNLARQVERFDFGKNRWSNVAPMPTVRAGASHVVFLGRLYVVGGYDHMGNSVNAVEYYNPSTNRWRSVAPMLHGRVEPAVCVSNGLIYALGGIDRGQALVSVERFHPDENAWTEMEFILPPTIGCGTVSFADGNWMYFAGGATSNVFVMVSVITGEQAELPDLPRDFSYGCLLKY